MSVFLSYATCDRPFVDKLSAELLRRGVKFWRDRHRLSPGAVLSEAIQQAVASAKFMCVVLTPNALRSTWVEREWRQGLERGGDLTIVPLLVQDCQVPEGLRAFLYADFRSEFDAGFQALWSVLRRVYDPELGCGSLRAEKYQLYYEIARGRTKEGGYALQLETVSIDLEESFCALGRFSLRTAASHGGKSPEDAGELPCEVLEGFAAAAPDVVGVSASRPCQLKTCLSVTGVEGELEATALVRLLGAPWGVQLGYPLQAVLLQVARELTGPTGWLEGDGPAT